MSDRHLGVIGVPSSAGSHNPGQEKAPAAWRAAGLIDRLEAAGLTVTDDGDLDEARYRPSTPSGGVRDLDRVVGVARATAAAVSKVRSAGQLPLVLGGDCTISLGVLAGLNAQEPTSLLYFDGDADLNTPETSGSAVLDTMGVTHLLSGGAADLAHLAGEQPLITPERLELFGFDPGELDTSQWTTLVTRQINATPAPAVREDPTGRAAAALTRLERHEQPILVHFDVDVMNTGAFPLANFPHFAGLTYDETAECLATFCASPRLAGLVVTEVNPDHDPGGELLDTMVGMLCRALAP